MSDLLGGAYVINLDRRVDRLEEFDTEMKKLDFPYTRFRAIETKPGFVGCANSHLAILKMARELGLKNVVVFEDDFTPLLSKDDFWDEIRNLFEKEPDFDVCMLGYLVFKSEEHSDRLMRVHNGQTASGYIVNNHFYDALINVYEKANPLLESTRQHWDYAVDQSWKVLQPTSKWYAIKKRPGLQRASNSDTGYEPHFVDYKT